MKERAEAWPMPDPLPDAAEAPAEPVDVPRAVEPIAYASSTGPCAPASHLVIGVLSLIFACGSGLFSGYTGLVSWMIVRFSSGFSTSPVRGPTVVPRALTASETAAVLGRLGAIGVAPTINPAQEATLTSMVDAAGQQLVPPLSGPGSVPLINQSITAFSTVNGGVMIQCSYAPNTSMLTLDATGKLVRLDITTFSPRGTITTFHQTPGSKSTTTSSSFLGLPPGRPVPALLMLLASTIHLLLGILLLVSAILLLARRRHGVGLQRLYAWIKIPMALLSGVVILWLMAVVSGGRLTRTPAFIVIAAVPTALSLAYSAVILAVVREPVPEMAD